jgi:hypothetical protein
LRLTSGAVVNLEVGCGPPLQNLDLELELVSRFYRKSLMRKI